MLSSLCPNVLHKRCTSAWCGYAPVMWGCLCVLHLVDQLIPPTIVLSAVSSRQEPFLNLARATVSSACLVAGRAAGASNLAGFCVVWLLSSLVAALQSSFAAAHHLSERRTAAGLQQLLHLWPWDVCVCVCCTDWHWACCFCCCEHVEPSLSGRIEPQRIAASVLPAAVKLHACTAP